MIDENGWSLADYRRLTQLVRKYGGESVREAVGAAAAESDDPEDVYSRLIDQRERQSTEIEDMLLAQLIYDRAEELERQGIENAIQRADIEYYESVVSMADRQTEQHFERWQRTQSKRRQRGKNRWRELARFMKDRPTAVKAGVLPAWVLKEFS